MFIPNYIEYVMMHLEEHGHKAYLVGGSVRDIFMECESKIHDFDIATSATPGEISKIFRKVIPTGIEYGTVTVIIRGESVEVTTLRKDGAYKDSRHPSEVTFTDDLHEDLSRRDFTINAIAIDIEGNVFDPFNGIKDIEKQIIKAVGNPNERFKEDPLRMMRAIRFTTQLGFHLDVPTFKSIRENAELINNISKERIRDELCKIILCDKPSTGIRLLELSNILYYILPELEACVKFNQFHPNHDKDVFEHTLAVLDNTPPRLNVRLAALFHDIAKPRCFTLDDEGIGHFYGHHIEGAKMCREILPKLKFDNKTVNSVSTLIKEHMSRYPELRTKTVKRLITRVGVENLGDLFALQYADIMGCKTNWDTDLAQLEELRKEVTRVLEAKEALTVKDLAINGHDLMRIGIQPGPEMGRILNKLLEVVLENPEYNNSNKLLDLAKQEVI